LNRPEAFQTLAGMMADADVQVWSERVPALLIRPGSYVAWAGADRHRLLAALTRWFGSA
jgi:hypothetical protein